MERVSEYLKGVYGVSEQAGGWIRKTIHETVAHFPPRRSLSPPNSIDEGVA